MTKIDPAIDAVRKVRHEISREFDNDPVRLIAYYVEMQRRIEPSKLVRGGEEDADEQKLARDPAQPGH